MPTIAEIIDIYPVAQYLCLTDMDKRGLYAGGVNISLPEKIRNIGISVERVYNGDPTDSTLTSTANYLYELCGRWGMQAQAINGTAGAVAGIVSNTQSPLPLDFEVSASSIIPAGGSSLIITAFIGCNIEFTRGNLTQNTTNTGSSYYSWDRATGLFVCYPDASLGEPFRIVPV